MYDMKPYLERIDQVVARGPFRDDWASLSAFRTPEWMRRAKFGIFIHWGAYSVPGFSSEWYPRTMYMRGSKEFEHHVKTYGPHKDFGYKDFIPRFTGERFDAEEWTELFARAGARYVVPVAEHHDGFQMYRSEISHWNAYEMGPKRDVLGEIKAGCEKRGLVLGASSHRVEHWFFLGHGREFESDMNGELKRGDLYWPAMPEGDHHDLYSEPAPTEEFLQDWLVRTCELVDRYHPSLLYFDWWIQHSAVRPYLKKFAAYYYNRAAEWGIAPAITYKHDAFMFGTAMPDVERGQFSDVKPFFWQGDTAIGLDSWGYTRDNRFKPARVILCDLVDIVSKNGAMLLNVGPRPDGTIGPEETAVLEEIGDWMRVNGEAIYDAGIWRKAQEGPTAVPEGQFTDGVEKAFTKEDIRFTVRGDALYAIVLRWPEDGRVTIRSLAKADASRLPVFGGIVQGVSVLGYGGAPEWSRDEQGLHVLAPGIVTDKPVTVKVTMA